MHLIHHNMRTMEDALKLFTQLVVHLWTFSSPVGQGRFIIGFFKYSFLPCSFVLSESLLGNWEAINAGVHYYYR